MKKILYYARDQLHAISSRQLLAESTGRWHQDAGVARLSGPRGCSEDCRPTLPALGSFTVFLAAPAGAGGQQSPLLLDDLCSQRS